MGKIKLFFKAILTSLISLALIISANTDSLAVHAQSITQDKEKMIALTFDDGPHKKYTDEMKIETELGIGTTVYIAVNI